MSVTATREIEALRIDKPALLQSGRGDAPDKRELFGVDVSLAGPDEVVACIMRWAIERRPALVNFMPVHGLIEARMPKRSDQLNAFDINACDGQPVRWALNFFHKAKLANRVYGPDTMAEVCRRSAQAGVGIYLYGSSPEVISKLQEILPDKFPGLEVVGATSPPFRELTEQEDAEIIAKINASGAGVVFIGLGCPKQDIFAFEHRERILGVQMCVGAAFNFHAGELSMAPAWMQKRGLEWLYRLYKEPRRLWKRYVITNSTFVYLFLRRMILAR